STRILYLPHLLRLPPLLSSFFFYCPSAPRHLPSFPTRRSSDLAHLLHALQRPAQHVPGVALVGGLLRGQDVAEHAPDTLLLGARSEEHTSELQSQSNLVCRLLLEKKKNNPLRRLRPASHGHIYQ